MEAHRTELAAERRGPNAARLSAPADVVQRLEPQPSKLMMRVRFSSSAPIESPACGAFPTDRPGAAGALDARWARIGRSHQVHQQPDQATRLAQGRGESPVEGAPVQSVVVSLVVQFRLTSLTSNSSRGSGRPFNSW